MTMTIKSFTFAGAQIAMPDPERIPVKRTRDALEHCIELRGRIAEAFRARDSARAAVNAVENAERVRLGDLYFENADHHDEHLGEAVEAAERAARDAQSHLSGLTRAEGKALAALRHALTAEADAWAVIARQDAKKALTKLATAVRMSEAARDDLDATLGVLRMLEQTGQIKVEARRGSYEFSLNPGVTGLRDALAKAAAELAGES